jgi:hypothetical protein
MPDVYSGWERAFISGECASTARQVTVIGPESEW